MSSRSLLPFWVLLLSAPAVAGFDVSTFKSLSRGSSNSPYNAAAAIDGDAKTAWQVDPEAENLGQWISIDVPMGKVDKVSVVVGWAESEKSWVDHARLKAARIEIYSSAGGSEKLVAEVPATFQDDQARQTIELPDTQVGDDLNGGRVKLVVTDVYAGRDYANLALGEFFVHLVEFAVPKVTISESSSAAEGHDAAAAVDGSAKTWWLAAASDEAPSLTFDHGRYAVSSIGLTAGPKGTARAKRVEVSQGGAVRIYDVPDVATTVWLEIPALVGYAGSGYGDVTLKVLETYTPGPVGLSEVAFKATQLDPF